MDNSNNLESFTQNLEDLQKLINSNTGTSEINFNLTGNQKLDTQKLKSIREYSKKDYHRDFEDNQERT